jgi:hypothetical protein
MAFIRGACMAVRTIVVPAAWKTAPKDAVKFDPAVTDQEPEVPEPVAEVEGQVAGLLHRPLARGVGGDAAEVHPAGAVLDEHQDIQPVQGDSIDVQEVDGEDPGGLRVQELPAGRAVSSRRRVDACGPEDLVDRGCRDRDAELGQLAVDAPVTPQRGSRAPGGQRAGRYPGTVAGRPGRRRVLASYFLAASRRCQASSAAGVTGKTPAQRRRGMNRVSAANQARSPGSCRIRPAFLRSTAFSCRSTSSSASFARSPRTITAARLNNQRISGQTILSSTRSANHHRLSRRRNRQVNDTIEFPGGTGWPLARVGTTR